MNPFGLLHLSTVDKMNGSGIAGSSNIYCG